MRGSPICIRLAPLLALTALVAGCGGSVTQPALSSSGGERPYHASSDAGAGTDMVILAAGDISCQGCAQQDTAALLHAIAHAKHVAAILPLGDEAYLHGSLSEFEANYAPSWGTPDLLAISHPVPGNHEYVSASGAGYFDYFDGAGVSAGVAGHRGDGYYSFEIGSWHLVALNSSDGCRAVSCDRGSPQQQWLAADLAAHPARCTLAYWHHPRYQGGTESGETERTGPLWETFYDSGGDVVINGHEHNYQQLLPLDRSGAVDPNGVRSFVVGTGGAGFHSAFGGPHESAIEARALNTHGVLEVSLLDGGYSWRFVATDGTVPNGTTGSEPCR